MTQAIVFPEKGCVKVTAIAAPTVQSGELLVRTEFSGVSQGTEIQAFTGLRPELRYPTVPGYQTVGVIEEVGPGVHGYAV